MFPLHFFYFCFDCWKSHSFFFLVLFWFFKFAWLKWNFWGERTILGPGGLPPLHLHIIIRYDALLFHHCNNATQHNRRAISTRSCDSSAWKIQQPTPTHTHMRLTRVGWRQRPSQQIKAHIIFFFKENVGLGKRVRGWGARGEYPSSPAYCSCKIK